MRLQLALLLIISIFTFSVQAAESELKMMSTMEIVEEASSAQARQELVNIIQTEEAQKELIKLGVDPKEAINRLASLSSSEVKSLTEQIKKAQAGGDFGVGGLIGVAVFIFLVLLITDILGVTKVFPFTRSIR